jgi:hypothetical protein
MTFFLVNCPSEDYVSQVIRLAIFHILSSADSSWEDPMNCRNRNVAGRWSLSPKNKDRTCRDGDQNESVVLSQIHVWIPSWIREISDIFNAENVGSHWIRDMWFEFLLSICPTAFLQNSDPRTPHIGNVIRSTICQSELSCSLSRPVHSLLLWISGEEVQAVILAWSVHRLILLVWAFDHFASTEDTNLTVRGTCWCTQLTVDQIIPVKSIFLHRRRSGYFYVLSSLAGRLTPEMIRTSTIEKSILEKVLLAKNNMS